MKISPRITFVVSLCALSVAGGQMPLAQEESAGTGPAAVQRDLTGKNAVAREKPLPDPVESPTDLKNIRLPVVKLPQASGVQTKQARGNPVDSFQQETEFNKPAHNPARARPSGSEPKPAENGLAAIFKSLLTDDEGTAKGRDSKISIETDLKPASPPASGSVKPRLAGIGEKGNRQSSFSGESQKIQLDETLRKIGTGSVITLIAAIAAIFLLKRFGAAAPPKTAQPSELHVIETFRMAAKSHLKLIQVGKSRFLIAVNADGIKSIQSVHPSFEQTLESFDPNTDDVQETNSNEPATAQQDHAERLDVQQRRRAFVSNQFGQRLTDTR